MLKPRLDILPAPQRHLWGELAATPSHFTLYGGTAIALHLGHRQSVDFDFFSLAPFQPRELLDSIPYLAGATVIQASADTLTCSVERGGPVQLSFFGDLRLGQAAPAENVEGPSFAIASLLDLAGTKVAVITQRAEAKDYLDIHALITQAGVGLPSMLAAAQAIYGSQFNPLISLKALTYHDDPSLKDLPEAVRRALVAAVRTARVDKIPNIDAIRRRQ